MMRILRITLLGRSAVIAAVETALVHGSGQRILARGLLHRQLEARDGSQAARLNEAYLRACGRLAGLIKAEPQVASSGKFSEWALSMLALLYDIAREEGRPAEEELVDIIQKALGGRARAVGGFPAVG